MFRENSLPVKPDGLNSLLGHGLPSIRRVEGRASKASRKANSRANAVEDDQDRQRGFDEDYASISVVER